jgi:hypothetical protein
MVQPEGGRSVGSGVAVGAGSGEAVSVEPAGRDAGVRVGAAGGEDVGVAGALVAVGGGDGDLAGGKLTRAAQPASSAATSASRAASRAACRMSVCVTGMASFPGPRG